MRKTIFYIKKNIRFDNLDKHVDFNYLKTPIKNKKNLFFHSVEISLYYSIIIEKLGYKYT